MPKIVCKIRNLFMLFLVGDPLSSKAEISLVESWKTLKKVDEFFEYKNNEKDSLIADIKAKKVQRYIDISFDSFTGTRLSKDSISNSEYISQDLRINLRYPILSPQKVNYKMDLNQLRRLKLSHKAEARQMALELCLLHIEAYYVQIALENMNKRKNNFSDLLQTTQDKFVKGAASKIDVEMIKLEKSRLEIEQTKLSNDLIMLREQYRILLGVALPKGGFILDFDFSNLDNFGSEKIANDTINLLKIELEAIKLQIKFERERNSLQLDLTSNLSLNNITPSGYIGVEMRYPLYDRSSLKKKVRSLYLTKKGLQLKLAKEESKALLHLKKLRVSNLNFEKVIAKQNEVLVLYHTIIDMLIKKFKAGHANTIEVKEKYDELYVLEDTRYNLMKSKAMVFIEYLDLTNRLISKLEAKKN